MWFLGVLGCRLALAGGRVSEVPSRVVGGLGAGSGWFGDGGNVGEDGNNGSDPGPRVGDA